MLVGKNILITGANSGIGKITALKLAGYGAKVFLACRSFEKTVSLISEISEKYGVDKVVWLQIDLNSLASVKNCANKFLSLNENLHCLINNAGVAGIRGLTEDGFEKNFGVNYLGHFLLTKLLLKKLAEDECAKIINVSSKVHTKVKKIYWENLTKKTSSLTGIDEYAFSKLANILFTNTLSQKLEKTKILTFSLHPGLVDTEIWRSLPFFLKPLLKLKGMLTAEEGAKTTLHCILNATYINNGKYFTNEKITLPSKLAQDKELAEKLWQMSLELTKRFYTN